jgi:hypothetical protein
VKSNVSLRDWQALSSYLDRQLDDRQHARLEMRLRDDPLLRSALDELRRTQVILRGVPKPRRRRNFTLTAEMVVARKKPSLAFPAMSLASALAGILFLVVFVGDLLINRLQQPTAQPMQAMVQELTTEVELDSQSLRELATPAPLATVTPQSLEQMAAPKAFAYPPPAELSTPAAEPQAESPADLAQAVEAKSTDGQPLPGEAARGLFGLTRQGVLGLEILLIVIAFSAGIAAIYLRRKAG